MITGVRRREEKIEEAEEEYIYMEEKGRVVQSRRIRRVWTREEEEKGTILQWLAIFMMKLHI